MFINISKVVQFSITDVMNVVYDVEKYHEFIDWCEVLVKNDTDCEKNTQATVKKGIFSHQFECNVKKKDRNISFSGAKLMAFKLDGNWNFEEIDQNNTKISFSMQLNIKIPLLENVIHGKISQFSHEIITLFEKRIEQIAKK